MKHVILIAVAGIFAINVASWVAPIVLHSFAQVNAALQFANHGSHR